MSDGGEGFVDVLPGSWRRTTVTGPLGQPVDAGWRLAGRTAYIEMATASGLSLAGGAEANDPMTATTTGTGELILAAISAGATRVVVGVGGSASTDGGLGAIEVLKGRTRGVQIVVAVDVRTRFVDAAATFAPQKGASSAQVGMLTRRLDLLAAQFRDRFGVDVGGLDGGGAAGGLAGGLVAATGAELVSGFDVVADAVGLADLIEGADLVISAEGFVDEESLNGKVVGGVLELAAAAGCPTLVVAGEVYASVGSPTVSLVDRFGQARATTDTAGCLEEIVFAELSNRAAER